MNTFIRGVELCSALGSDLTQCVDNLFQQRSKAIEREVSHLSEPISFPYFSIAGRPLADNFHLRLEETLISQIDSILSSHPLSAADRKKSGLFIGSSSLDIEQSEQAYRLALEKNPDRAVSIPIIGYNRVGDKLRRRYGFSAYQFTVTTACTSSANALLLAHRYLQLQKIDHAVVVGFELYNDTTALGFKSLNLISPTATFKPFDEEKDGMILGEGCATLLLSREPVDKAIELRGGANNTDSYSLTAANPDGSSIAQAIEQAVNDSGVGVKNIKAIKLHGTASALNDEAEAAGIKQVFSNLPDLFALKPFTGHTLGACGAIECALTVECLQRNKIPINEPASLLPLNSAAKPAASGHYLLNFSGFGGNNTALVLTKS